MKIKITEQEKQIIEKLNHPLYSVKFLQEWINRKETVFENAPCALQCCCAHGYYDAVKQIAKMEAANAEVPKHPKYFPGGVVEYAPLSQPRPSKMAAPRQKDAGK